MYNTSLALPPLRMERKGLVKPVYTTCPIGMHLRFLRHMLLMARNVYCVGCREDISIKSSDRKDE